MADPISFSETAAAVVYQGANIFNWGKNALLPWFQAYANIKILERQEEQYEDISNDRQRLIDAAVDRYVSRIQATFPRLEKAYPDVPLAAAYVPVDPCLEQTRQIECNINKTTKANEWAIAISRLQAQSDYTRMVVLDPRWYANIELYSLRLGDLLNAKLGISDLMEVVTATAEMSLATGRVGGSHKAGRRNVALERLRFQTAGRVELRREAEMLNRISPTTRMASASEMMQTPQQRIALALTQAQLIQNSLQNVYNSKAEKPPHRMAELNLKLETIINRFQLEASKAGLANTFVPNYAAIFQPVVNALTDQVGEAANRPFSPNSSANDPQFGGDYLEQNGGANPYTCDTGARVGGFRNFKS